MIGLFYHLQILLISVVLLLVSACSNNQNKRTSAVSNDTSTVAEEAVKSEHVDVFADNQPVYLTDLQFKVLSAALPSGFQENLSQPLKEFFSIWFPLTSPDLSDAFFNADYSWFVGSISALGNSPHSCAVSDSMVSWMRANKSPAYVACWNDAPANGCKVSPLCDSSNKICLRGCSGDGSEAFPNLGSGGANLTGTQSRAVRVSVSSNGERSYTEIQAASGGSSASGAGAARVCVVGGGCTTGNTNNKSIAETNAGNSAIRNNAATSPEGAKTASSTPGDTVTANAGSGPSQINCQTPPTNTAGVTAKVCIVENPTQPTAGSTNPGGAEIAELKTLVASLMAQVSSLMAELTKYKMMAFNNSANNPGSSGSGDLNGGSMGPSSPPAPNPNSPDSQDPTKNNCAGAKLTQQQINDGCGVWLIDGMCEMNCPKTPPPGPGGGTDRCNCTDLVPIAAMCKWVPVTPGDKCHCHEVCPDTGTGGLDNSTGDIGSGGSGGGDFSNCPRTSNCFQRPPLAFGCKWTPDRDNPCKCYEDCSAVSGGGGDQGATNAGDGSGGGDEKAKCLEKGWYWTCPNGNCVSDGNGGCKPCEESEKKCMQGLPPVAMPMTR